MVTDRSTEAEPTPPQGSDYSENASKPDEGTVDTEHHDSDPRPEHHDSDPRPADQKERDESTVNTGCSGPHIEALPDAEQYLMLTKMINEALPPNLRSGFEFIIQAGHVLRNGEAIGYLGEMAVKGLHEAGATAVKGAKEAAEHLDRGAMEAAARLNKASNANRDSARATKEAMGHNLPANVGVDQVMQDGAARDEDVKKTPRAR
jgi:hypothetical protein